jgi:hypothetical protein
MSKVPASPGAKPETPTNPVPFQADGYANKGERCGCGRPAVVYFDTRGYGRLPFCGRHG